MSTIKFEKGRFYKTRDGRKVECVYAALAGDHPHLFVVENEGTFFSSHADGMCYIGGDNPYDIISEWREEHVVYVVCTTKTGEHIVLDNYPAAKNLYNCYWHRPTRSLTRVVIKEGHLDDE